MVVLIITTVLVPIQSPLAGESEEVYSVSLLRVLTTPETFEGHVLRVMGFLKYEGELRLYVTRDHAEIGDRRSSTVVVDTTVDASLTESTCPMNYVSVTGTFRKFPDGSFGLIDIREVVNRNDLEKCWAMRGPG